MQRYVRTVIPLLIVLVLVVVIGVLFGYATPAGGLGIGIQPTPTPLGATAEQVTTAEDNFQTNYSWVDQKAGIAHIPIVRAMDIVVQKGLPSHQSGPDAQSPGRVIPSYSSSGTQTQEWLH